MQLVLPMYNVHPYSSLKNWCRRAHDTWQNTVLIISQIGTVISILREFQDSKRTLPTVAQWVGRHPQTKRSLV